MGPGVDCAITVLNLGACILVETNRSNNRIKYVLKSKENSKLVQKQTLGNRQN